MKKIYLLLFCIVFVFSACNASQTPPLATQATEPPMELESMPEVNDELPTDSMTESESETQPNSESELAITNETAIVERIDIQHLLGEGETTVLFEDVRHVFGTFLEYGYDQISIPHHFEGGITAYASNLPNNIEEAPLIGIVIDYRQSSSPIAFHFDGIDGTCTLNDVIEHFGNPEPYSIRSGIDEDQLGAIQSYGYFAFERRLARFFFDEEHNVVAISLFIGHPQ